MVAVKQINLRDFSEDQILNLMKEVDVLKRLSHPRVVKYQGMVRSMDTLNIVLKYALLLACKMSGMLILIRYVENGSLDQTIKAFGKLNERLAASYIIKILEGLLYLHTSHVVHCNLKATNILTIKNGNLKLSDFGISLYLHTQALEAGAAGTLNWSKCRNNKSGHVLTANHSGPRSHRA
jgi:serine/threonine protein kinase